MAPTWRQPSERSFLKRETGVAPAGRDLFVIALVCFSVDAIAAALLFYVYFPARQRDVLSTTPAQLSLLARDRQNALAGWVRERTADAELGASLLAAGPAASDGVTVSALEVLERFIRAYGYESAFIIDEQGKVLLRSGSAETDDRSAIAFGRETIAGAGSKIDFRRVANGKPKVLTAHRFLLPGAAGQAVVVFVSDPYEYVYPMLNTFSGLSRTGETNLIGLYGETGLALSPYRSGAPPPMTLRLPIPKDYAANALASGERTVRYVDRRGMPVIGVVKAIPLTPWVVVVKLDDNEVLAGAVAETKRLAYLLAFVSLMLAATAFMILRSRRVHKLRLAEDQLARLFENSTTGILMLEVIFDEHRSPADHQVVDMNPAAEQLLGVNATDEIGKRSGDAAYLQWSPEVRASNYRVALTGVSVHYEQFIPARQRWYDARAFSPRYGQFAQLLTDITERKKAEEAVRNLSARLLRVQDDANRRIARQLHETIAQSLAGIHMNLAMIKRSTGPIGRVAALVDDSVTITQEAITEIRTLSYLLHPPMIDQAGLLTTLRWYIEGFEQRSGITTTLDAPDDLGRLSQDVETSMFRVIQESLTNIQRHANSPTARVSIERNDDHLSIAVSDQGRGLSPALRGDSNVLLASGVGIAGMNERVHELGGEMAVQSSDAGTTVTVTLPVGT